MNSKKISLLILQIKDRNKSPYGKIDKNLIGILFSFSEKLLVELSRVKVFNHQPSDYISCFNRIDPSLLWKPDLFLYNSASESFDATFPVNMVVSSNGRISQIPPGIFKSTCLVSYIPGASRLSFYYKSFYSQTFKYENPKD